MQNTSFSERKRVNKLAEINFQIDSAALQTIQNTELKANFEETKEALAEIVYPYTKLIVSEDAISSAKSDRAKINRLKLNIDSYRKMVKAAYNEPYKRVEEKFKELTAICDTGINNIDGQVAEYEKKRKDEKLFLLKEYYKNAGKKNPEYCSFEFALHPKWDLKGTTLEQCKCYIDNAIQKVDSEVFAIKGMHSEWETAMLADYQRTHDMLSAMEVHERMTRVSQQESERRKKEQEAFDAKPIQKPRIDSSEEKEPVYIASFRVYGTLEEINAVQRYCTNHGIELIYDGKEKTDKPIEVLL